MPTELLHSYDGEDSVSTQAQTLCDQYLLSQEQGLANSSHLVQPFDELQDREQAIKAIDDPELALAVVDYLSKQEDDHTSRFKAIQLSHHFEQVGTLPFYQAVHMLHTLSKDPETYVANQAKIILIFLGTSYSGGNDLLEICLRPQLMQPELRQDREVLNPPPSVVPKVRVGLYLVK